MQKRIYISLIVALLALWAGEAAAQGAAAWRTARRATAMGADSLRLPKWEPHVGVTTGFLGTGHGDSRLFSSVAPSLTFHPSDRWSLTGGFRLTADYGLDGHYHPQPARSMAPVRNGGTRVASAYVEAEYQASDRLWLAASVYHLGGEYAPLFGPANGTTLDLSATALSAQAAFRFDNNSTLYLSFTAIRDNAGTLPYLWLENWQMGGWGCWNGWNRQDRFDRWNSYDRWF